MNATCYMLNPTTLDDALSVWLGLANEDFFSDRFKANKQTNKIKQRYNAGHKIKTAPIIPQ